jgi:hypothetical protein
MRCETAQVQLSAAMEEALASDVRAEVDAHVAGCPACRSFQRTIDGVRQGLRFEVVGEVPDIASRLSAAVAGRPRQRWRPSLVAAVAAAVAGVVLGASVVSGTRPGATPRPVAADMATRMTAAQTRLDALAASVHVVERNWHSRVAERRFEGTLRYRAPESVALRLDDRTVYPDGGWRRNDTAFVVDGERLWASGPAACPVVALPRCTPARPRIQVIDGREPFAPDAPAPLDFVLPVNAFADAFADATSALVVPGDASVGGRPATRVLATVAQAQPLLAGLHRAGNWRRLHPSDPVELWLDRDALVPLRTVVRVAGGSERRRWAAANGYGGDEPGQAILEIELDDVDVNGRVAGDSFPPAPPAPVVRHLGFSAGGDPPVTARAGEGLRPHRSGVVLGADRPVHVASWADGRAWVTLRSTTAWTGGRLFGDVGDVVREVTTATGVVYVSVAGDRVAVHGEGVDLVLSGTVGPDALVAMAASTGVHGLPVPPAWAEAPGTKADAVAAVAGLLSYPRSDRGEPAIRVREGAVTQVFTGPGSTGFALAQSAGDRLAPPFDLEVIAVRVRGVTGRYSAAAGSLEWVEGGTVVELRSPTMTLDELVAVATALRPWEGGR